MRLAALLLLLVAAAAAAGASPVLQRLRDDPAPALPVVELTPGVPTQGFTAGADEYADFEVVTPPTTDKVLQVTVTSITESDPDLYLSVSDPRPRQGGDGVRESRAFGEDFITVTDYAASSKVYMSVAGYNRASNFTIVAAFEDSIELEDGVPQAGQVNHTQTRHYVLKLDANVPHQDLSVTATPLSGVPRVYVSNTGKPDPANNTTYQWSSPFRSSGEPVVIPYSAATWPKHDDTVTFYVAVFGYTETSYSLVAATDRSPALLRDGLPQQGFAEGPSGAAYYRAELADGGCDFDVVVTALSGSPALLVSRIDERPDANSTDLHTATATLGEDRVVWRAAEAGPFYVAVVPGEDGQSTSFTVTAFSDCDHPDQDYSVLVSGVPQSASMNASEYRYFRMRVSGLGPEGLDITVSRRFGDPDLVIGTGENSAMPTRGSNETLWRSSSYGEDSVHIGPEDPNFVADGVYNIGVYAFTDTSFTIVAVAGDNSDQLLQVGRSYRRDLSEGEQEYFSVQVDRSDQDLTVSVVDLGVGDPDVYVGLVERPQPPNGTDNGTALWLGRRLRSDTVTVPHDDPRAAACFQAGGGRCRFFVTVHAYHNTSFTIAASLDEETVLQPGVPQSGAVAGGGSRSYVVQVLESNQTDLTITAQSLDGMVDLYVATGHEATRANHDWQSAWYSSRQTVLIRADDEKRCDTNLCEYHITVDGFTDANYTIVATTANRTVPLLRGVPQQDYVEAGQYDFFSFRVLRPGLSVAFAVTPVSGDPDLWVSAPLLAAPANDTRHNNARPRNAASSTHHSRSYGADQVVVEDAEVGTYYVGVQAFEESTFTVVALVSDPDANDTLSTVGLVDGAPQSSFVFKDHFSYFTLYVPEPDAAAGDPAARRLVVTVSKQWGDPDLFVNRGLRYMTPEDRHDSDWQSSSFREDRLEIGGEQDGGLEAGVYTIGVFGFTASAFTVTAATTTVHTQLQAGVPLRAEVAAGAYNYYDFDLGASETNETLVFVLTPLFGAPELYVSYGRNRTGDKPGPNNAATHWNSSASGETEAVVVRGDDVNRCQDGDACVYHLGVTSRDVNATYTVVAFVDDGRTSRRLQEGVPQSGYVDAGGVAYFAVEMPRESELDLTISVDAKTGGPVTYVSQERANPNSTNFNATADWRSEELYTGRPVVVRHEELHDCGVGAGEEGNGADASCVFHIGVEGGDRSSVFTITATGQNASTVLQNGVPARAHVDTGETKYFEFRSLGEGHSLAFILTPLSGDADMFVSHNVTRPSNGVPGVRGSQFQGEDVVVYAAGEAEAGDYFVAVYGYENSTFTVQAYVDYNNGSGNGNETDSVQTLLRGQPQTGFLGRDSYLYYAIDVVHEHADLTVTLSRRVGDPDLYVGHPNGTRPVRDDNTTYLAKSTSFGEDIVVLSRPARGRYVIGVWGFTDCFFTLVATTSDSITALSDGVPVRDHLIGGETEYFYIDAAGHTGQALSVSVTPLSGDPDLYVSHTNQQPHSTDTSEAYARGLREDTVTIPPGQLDLGTYYVGVSAFTNCSFYVTATFQNTSQLIDGVPAGDTVDENKARFFSVDVQKAGRLNVALTPFVGNAYVYLAYNRSDIVFGRPSSYDWESTSSASAQYISVGLDDDGFHASGTYYIMVYGRALNTTVFALTATTENAQLQSGVPLHASVDEGEYGYFRFETPADASEVQVAVTPLSGEVELYVSTSNQKPTNADGEFDESSALPGANAVTLTPDDDFWAGGAPVYIGVFAAGGDATFVVTAESHAAAADNHTILLVDGVPQANEITDERAEDHYTFTPSSDVSSTAFALDFSVSVRYGDADVYVSTEQWVREHNNTLPSAAAAQWVGNAWGQEELVISRDDPDFCANCTYYVTVAAFQAPALYSITAKTTDAVALLENGVAVVETLPSGLSAYFQITVLEPNQRLELSVLGNSDGDPDLFVGFDTEDEPNDAMHHPSSAPGHHTKSSALFGDDTLVMDPAAPGRYWVAVLAASGEDVTYTLTATVGTAAALLEQGIPAQGVVGNGELRKYRFAVVPRVKNFNEVIVTLTAASGVAQGLLSMSSSYSYASAWPSSEDDAMWSTSGNSSSVRGVITVDRSEMGACDGPNGEEGLCEFHLTVRGVAPTSEYSVTFQTNERSVLLRDGQAVQGHVEKDETRFYEYPVGTAHAKDVDVSLTVYWGSAMLYVSNTSRPGPDNALWSSTNQTSSVHLAIPADELSDKLGPNDGVLYMAMSSADFSSYLISASSGALELASGFPQEMAGPPDGHESVVDHFRVQVQAKNKELHFALAAFLPEDDGSIGGASAADATFEVYFKWSSDRKDRDNAPPTKGDNDWSEVVHSGKVVVISRAVHPPCDECGALLITVVSKTAYSASASSAETPRVLSNNVAVEENVPAGTFQYYELPVQVSESLVVTAEPCSGDVSLYVSTTSRLPDEHYSDIQSTKSNAIERIEINRVNLSSVIVGVQGLGHDPVFKVRAQYKSDEDADPVRVPAPELAVSSAKKGEVTVRFHQANSSNPAAVRYRVYALRDDGSLDGLVPYTVCGLERVADSAFTKVLDGASASADGSLTFHGEGFEPGADYHINVVAHYGDSAAGKVAYRPATLKVLGSGGSGLPLSPAALVAIGVAAFVVVGGLICYLCVKNRRMKKELDVEMHDVPKSAVLKATRGPPSARQGGAGGQRAAKNYSRLLTTDDDDDVESATDYNPPGVDAL